MALQGFVISNVKRVEGHEFDVIAVKDGVIYNVQCKNNLVDLSRMELNPRLFARYNNRLDRSYAQALNKEEAREDLLLNKLGLSDIKHIVISKFPLATKNPRVMTFHDIREFSSRFGNP